MKKFRFVFLVLALILVVGMTTGVIVRKQTGSQTVVQHSGGGSAASTTPATEEPEEPEEPSPALGLLDRSTFPLYVNVPEGVTVEIAQNGQTLQPVSRVEVPFDSGALSGAKPADYHYHEICDLFFVNTTNSITINLLSDSKEDGEEEPYYTLSSFYFARSDGILEVDSSEIYNTSYTIYPYNYLIVYLDFSNSIQVD